ALEKKKVIRCESDHIEAQSASRAGQSPSQIRAGPIHYGHKVVAHDVDARPCDRRERVLPRIRELPKRSSLQLDGVVNRDAFDNPPAQSGGPDPRLALEH